LTGLLDWKYLDSQFVFALMHTNPDISLIHALV
jgi:hypothetical protein